jgi:death-on-curing protein
MTSREPRWLSRSALLAIHDALLREHGGLAGVRELGLLDSALARPKYLRSLGSAGADVFELAACYALAIAQGHPFHDGKKRTGFLAAYVFLKDNGFTLRALETDVVRVMVLAAQNEIDQTELARWMRECTQPNADEPRT